MQRINLFSKSVLSQLILASSLLMISSVIMAQDVHHMHADLSNDAISTMEHAKMDHHTMHNIDHSQMNHSLEDTSQKNEMVVHAQHQSHDHQAEHGGQIYAITTLDHQWQVNEGGNGTFKSELDTRIGTDENKLFIKIHADKDESHDPEFDIKLLYSHMISDFWDVQVGARYRDETIKLSQNQKDTEKYVDAVIGLHGMAPYFFETDAYLYIGEDHYSGLSLATERDLLLTQKLILKPYLDVDIILNDDAKYAKKSGLSGVTTGIEIRYEMNKKVMPYVDFAYQYVKGNAETAWQQQVHSEKNWQYGAGFRFKF